MSKLGINNYKFINTFMGKIIGPWFHTSRSPILPSLGRGEEKYTPDYLQCLRPATMAVSEGPILAGDPRIPGPNGLRIESEVYRKWNVKPEMPPKDWSSFSWWGRSMY